MYKWDADETKFAMPVRVGVPGEWKTIHPTTAWQTIKTPLSKEQLQVDVDHFYIEVNER